MQSASLSVGAVLAGIVLLSSTMGSGRRWLFPRSYRRGFLRALLAMLGVIGSMSCQKGAPPSDARVAAAENPVAQRELRDLEAEWAVASSLERQRMRGRLEQFVQRWQEDTSAVRARLLLARALLLSNNAVAAEQALAPVLALPAGLSRDEASIVLAAVRHHQKRDVEALALLEPLAGKLVTDEARHEFAEVRVQAALAARRWRLAVDTMVAWVDDAGARTDDVRPWVARAVVEVPDQALARVLEDWSAQTVESDGRTFVTGVMVHHLVKRALETDDPRLARQLLENSPAWLRTSDAGDELTVLSSRAEEGAHVSGRLVGVVVGGPDSLSQTRSAALAAGLMQGLSAARAAGQAEAIGLVFEGADAGVRPALAALRGQGAVVLVAATDPVSSLEALAFAESRRVPVVVLATPPELSAERLQYGFDFGVALDRQRQAIEAALGNPGRFPVAFVGPNATPCPAFESRPGQSTLPLGEWRELGVRTIGLLGDAHCAKQVISDTAGLPLRPTFVLGLEAGSAEELARIPVKRPLYVAHLAVGRYPVSVTARKGDRFEAGEGGGVQVAPSFFEAVGRDLAALLAVALTDVPTSPVSDPAAVRRVHDQVRDGLEGAKADLITADSPGFLGKHQIERKMRVVGLDAP